MENHSPAGHWLIGKGQAWGFMHREEQTLADSANEQLSGRSVTSVTVVPSATGYPDGLLMVRCTLVCPGEWTKQKCRFHLLWSKRVLSDSFVTEEAFTSLFPRPWYTRVCARQPTGDMHKAIKARKLKHGGGEWLETFVCVASVYWFLM